MTELNAHLEDLVIANRILAHEGVADGLGHVSLRHPERPDRFFMSRSRSPELVTLDDIMEFDLDCNPIDQRGRVMYGERAIHGAIYQARADVGRWFIITRMKNRGGSKQSPRRSAIIDGGSFASAVGTCRRKRWLASRSAARIPQIMRECADRHCNNEDDNGRR